MISSLCYACFAKLYVAAIKTPVGELTLYQAAASNGSIAEGADQTRKRNLGKRCVMTAGLRFQYQTIAV